MRFIKRLMMGLFLCVVFAAHTSSANDSSFGDDNGTIVFKNQTDISMDKETLWISEEKILVDYVFTNTSQHDLVIPIAFPMPPMYFGPEDHTTIQDFKLSVNGKPLKTKRKLVVLLDGVQDISEKAHKLGWDEDSLSSFLESQELPKGKKPLPTAWFDKSGEPRFTLHEYFIWQQPFAAGKSVTIHHSYTPSISTGVPQMAADIIRAYEKETCLDKNAQAGVKKREREFGVGWAHLGYILVTGNNWQGPIKEFHLTIKKQKASDLLSLCFDDELKKTGPLTFEFHTQNFRPTRNLNVLFIRKPE